MSAQTVLFDAPGPKGRVRNLVIGIVGVVLCLALGLGLLWALRTQLLDVQRWLPFVEGTTWTAYVIPGLINTLQAAAISIITASVLGVLLGLGRLSTIRLIKVPAGVIVEVFRAIPVLMMMLFFYYVFLYSGMLSGFMLPLVSVIGGLTLYNGSVIAELIRSGVKSLPKGQREAGLAVGLSENQTLRSVLLPQAITAMLPSLLSQLVVVLKDTALGFIITYPDLLQSMNILAAGRGNLLAAFVVAAVIYILINYGVTKLAGTVERTIRQRRGIHTVTAAPVEAPDQDESATDALATRP
ncbi:amino acid ABC transporter permease [Microlunatus sp. Y2014]|uniref:amino acid ABC transporter permease n=1 Tax=Microlunatus sp. Y2014 TaxID=3418488 RepID=UPI003DA75E25